MTLPDQWPNGKYVWFKKLVVRFFGGYWALFHSWSRNEYYWKWCRTDHEYRAEQDKLQREDFR